MANVRTMDDLRREEAGRGVRPTPNPWAGGAAPAQGAPAPNFTPAGGYTPIPDQQSMGGVGAGDVYIDACGETIPVSSLSPWQLPMAMCCPCCIGDPCSENRRNWYVNQMKTFIGIISIIQIFIFIIEVSLSGWVGILDVPSDVLYVMGGKVASNIAAGEYWRLITPIMLHAGIFHLVINVFTQCMFGIQLEREWGGSQIAIIYVVAGVYGNVLSVLFAPYALSIGCSGSVFGLFGAQVTPVNSHCICFFISPLSRLPTLWGCGVSSEICRRKCSCFRWVFLSSSSLPSPSESVSTCLRIWAVSWQAW
mmetsp:Transcript_27484/g.72570  ORF Transcript_27484/g.72570 Transcript_27484/m.72570 type:complete len:308 (+) Transcript_27484:73-996(+)